MRNLRVTAMVAGALVSGLVLGGIGIATAATSGAKTPATIKTSYGVTDATSTITPPSGDTTPSVTPTGTTRPPMPPQAKGHAYGRVISHPHCGLHFGWASTSLAPMHGAQRKGGMRRSVTGTSHRNSSHKGGSMMGR